jgi:predicted nuclease of predicted toxin-antitoxin system
VKFVVDNQLPKALALFLASRGVECEHVLDLGLGDASDARIWEYANRNACVVISKDEDFLYLAKARVGRARLVWIRLGNCRKRVLLAAIEAAWSSIEEKLNAGDSVVELR